MSPLWGRVPEVEKPGSTDSSDCLPVLLSISVFFTFYRAMLCMRGTSHGPVFVSVSVRNRRSTETANRRITQTTPHDSASEVTTLWRYTNLFIIIIIIRRPIICTVKMLAVMVDLVSSCDRQTDTPQYSARHSEYYRPYRAVTRC